MTLQRAGQQLAFLVTGLAPRGRAETKTQTARVALTPLFHHALAKGDGGFDVLRIVHHHQRLQRRVGIAPHHRAGFAGGGVKEGDVGWGRGALPEGVDAAAMHRLAAARQEDLGGEGLLVTEMADLAPQVGLWRMHARATHLLVEQPTDGECLVANDFSGQARARRTRKQGGTRVLLQALSRGHGGLTIGLGIEDEFEKMTLVPAAFHEFHREPVEQVGMRGPGTLVAEVACGLHHAAAKDHLPQTVDRNAGRQRVLFINHPLGQVETGGIFPSLVRRQDGRGIRQDLLVLESLIVGTAIEDVGFAQLRLVIHDHHGGLAALDVFFNDSDFHINGLERDRHRIAQAAFGLDEGLVEVLPILQDALVARHVEGSLAGILLTLPGFAGRHQFRRGMRSQVFQLREPVLEPGHAAVTQGRAILHDGFGICVGRPLARLRGAVEEGVEAEVFLLGNRVVLVVVALGALHGQAQHGGGDGIHLIDRVGHPIFLGNGAALMRVHAVAQETGGRDLVGCGVGDEIAGQLLGDEPVIGLILHEGVDDPVAPSPHVTVVVNREAVGVGVARGV